MLQSLGSFLFPNSWSECWNLKTSIEMWMHLHTNTQRLLFPHVVCHNLNCIETFRNQMSCYHGFILYIPWALCREMEVGDIVRCHFEIMHHVLFFKPTQIVSQRGNGVFTPVVCHSLAIAKAFLHCCRNRSAKIKPVPHFCFFMPVYKYVVICKCLLVCPSKSVLPTPVSSQTQHRTIKGLLFNNVCVVLFMM